MANRVNIRIRNQNYPILAEEDEGYIQAKESKEKK